MWAQRVRAWRTSGQTADQFAEGEGYAGSTLRWYASRLGRGGPPRFLQLVPRSASSAHEAGLLVEVGPARVRVMTGFDAKLLAEVVSALGGDR